MITFAYSDNSETVERSLAGFQAALADNAPAFGEIADDFRELAAEQFATEGRAGGTPWAPRVRPTLASARPRQASPLLVRTGALRDSLTRKGAAASIEEVNGQTLSIGSRLPYAIFHQLGTRRMPARPLIMLGDARSAKWTGLIERAIDAKTLVLGKAEMT